eukprot:6629302-Alexandrium_andersonii.AAC.1
MPPGGGGAALPTDSGGHGLPPVAAGRRDLRGAARALRRHQVPPEDGARGRRDPAGGLRPPERQR